MRNQSLNRDNIEGGMENRLQDSLLNKGADAGTKVYKNNPYQLLLIFGMILFTYGLIAALMAGLIVWANASTDTPEVVFAIVFAVFFTSVVLLTFYGEKKRPEKERKMIDAKLKEKEEESNLN